MPFSLSSETASRLISSMRTEDLKAPGAVDRLIELTESDGKLTTEEKTALKGVLVQFQQSGFDASSAKRLEAFLGMSNASFRHEAAKLSQDGVIDIADAGKLVATLQKDGRLSGTERMTARAAMIAFKMAPDAQAKIESAIAEPAGTGPFAGIQFKDAALRNTLAGFTGITTLGAPQIEALLKAAADGTGISTTEKTDLTMLFKNHASLIDRPGQAALAHALGIPFTSSGLDLAPKGDSKIRMMDEGYRSTSGLELRKGDDGKVQVRISPASIRDYGWLDVKEDGTFGTSGRTEQNSPGYWQEWTVKGKVTFANGSFTAETEVHDIDHSTRPQGSNDTPNWNSGNRIPQTSDRGGKFSTTNHPSRNGVIALEGTATRGSSWNPGPSFNAVMLKNLDGTRTIQLQTDTYGQRIPIGADGKVDSGMWKGEVRADGSFTLRSEVYLGASYTERLEWNGKINLQ